MNKAKTNFILMLLVVSSIGCGSINRWMGSEEEAGFANDPVASDPAAVPYTAPVDRVVTLGCDQACESQCGSAPSADARQDNIDTFEYCNNNCTANCLAAQL